MDLAQRKVSDERIQLLQVSRVVPDAGQVEVLFEKLARRFPKRPFWPNPEVDGLSDLLDPTGVVALGTLPESPYFYRQYTNSFFWRISRKKYDPT